jgi:hypothetical protein
MHKSEEKMKAAVCKNAKIALMAAENVASEELDMAMRVWLDRKKPERALERTVTVKVKVMKDMEETLNVVNAAAEVAL